MTTPIDGKAIRVYFDTEGNALPGNAIRLYPSNINEYLTSDGNTFIEDAPADGRVYGRKNNTWTNNIALANYVMVVDANGNGDYETIEEAFAAVTMPTDVIFLTDDVVLTGNIGDIPSCIITGLLNRSFIFPPDYTCAINGTTVFQGLIIASTSNTKALDSILIGVNADLTFNNCKFENSGDEYFGIDGSGGKLTLSDVDFVQGTFRVGAEMCVANNVCSYNNAIVQIVVQDTGNGATSVTNSYAVSGDLLVTDAYGIDKIYIANSYLQGYTLQPLSTFSQNNLYVENTTVKGVGVSAFVIGNGSVLGTIQAHNCYFWSTTGHAVSSGAGMWNPAALYHCRFTGTLSNVTVPAANYPIMI